MHHHNDLVSKYMSLYMSPFKEIKSSLKTNDDRARCQNSRLLLRLYQQKVT